MFLLCRLAATDSRYAKYPRLPVERCSGYQREASKEDVMEVRMSDEMLAALRDTPEIPDNLRARVEGAVADGGEFVVTLDDEEQIAMTEMCEWYVRKDPETGEFTSQGKVFEDIVQRILDAEMEQ